MTLSLLRTCTISPVLTFDVSYWLCIKHLWSTTFQRSSCLSDPSSAIFSLKYCLFLLQCTSFSWYLGTQLKNIASLTVSNLPDLLPSLGWVFFFLLLSVAFRNWLLYPLRVSVYIVSLRKYCVKTVRMKVAPMYFALKKIIAERSR